MIKLLIADDEHIVIESIKFIIEKYVDNVEVVGSARSGREAIEKAIDLKPDVIFMDIRMPGINGIEAIKQIQATNNDIRFVIITAFEYFEYAKEAINLGVSDYILKPLNKEKVIETINSLNQTISLKREAIQREIVLKEKINKIIPHLEGQFIYSQLFNGEATRDIDFYEGIFNMELDYGYVIMGVVDDLQNTVKEESIKNSLQKQKFYDIFSMEIKNLTKCLIGPPLLDRTVAYIPCNRNMDSYEIRNKSIGIANNLMERINKNVNINYRIGVGRSYDIEKFSESYNEASMVVSASNNDRVNHFEDIVLSLNKNDSYPSTKEKELIHKIIIGDLKGSLDIFEEMFRLLSVNYNQDIDKIKSRLIELLIVLQRSLPYDIKEKEISEHSFLIYMLKIKNIRELQISYTNHLKNIIVSIINSREQELDGLISNAIKYINNNYDKNISLDDVAKETNMSYHYFSKFFKESLGKNFVDYLTELRIDKSKELLKKENISIKEVCYKIGYSDPNYFSKIFKKITGMTPTEYKANVISQEVM